MAIDRIPLINLAPQISQRLDLSNVTPLAPSSVPALVQLAPYSTALPESTPGGGAAPVDGLRPSGSNALVASIGAILHDSSAMQLNQLFFTRQLVWQAPNPATLAASWRIMVRTYGEQRAALEEQARGQHVPSTLFMAEPNPASLREGARPPLTVDADAWRFAVYGGGGQRLMLRVLASDQDDDDEAAPRRRHGKVALRLELLLADLGRVQIQIEPLAEGILLELAAAAPAAQQLLRQMLPELVEAIGRAGLRILRCRIGRELHSARMHNNYPMQAAAAALSLPVYRAMAEVALLLAREAPRRAHPELAPPQEPDNEAQMQEQDLTPHEAPALEPDLVPDPELEAEVAAEVEASMMQLELELEPPEPSAL